uniref:Uncharacterized protein LOC102801291 n=1 Tax=Saccoglossus kowalevskii TaxID=10224 RepID=A0ABM0MEV0_SACKO|nr:PREDICTED: uncharacterized protein LOC102801291 [Saccoglossus kowalevskii]
MLPWSAGRRTVHKSGKRSSTFIENSENSSTLSNYSQEDRRKGHSSSFSRSPIKITKRPRFQSPAGPLLNSPLSSPSAGGLTPANNASLQISPVSVTAKRYHVCSPELHSHASPCETSTDRFLAMGQRRYPTHQAQYSSLGLLPSVKWKGGSTIQNALSSHSPHGRNSPVTVKIAAHDGIRSPSPMLQRHNGMVDPLNKETILSALRESKKRTLMQENNEDNSSTASSLFEKGSKRRRCDNSSSCSGSTWVTATPSQSGRNTPIYNGDLNNTDLKSSEGGSMKRSRNAIECSYSSSRRVRQRKDQLEILSQSKFVLEREWTDLKTPPPPLATLALPGIRAIDAICNLCHKGHKESGNRGSRECCYEPCAGYMYCCRLDKHREHSKALRQKDKEIKNVKDKMKALEGELQSVKSFIASLPVFWNHDCNDSSQKIALDGKLSPGNLQDAVDLPKLLEMGKWKVSEFKPDDDDVED